MLLRGRCCADALKRAGMPCNVSVLVNDTISVMAAARYLDPATEIGIILGTGRFQLWLGRRKKAPYMHLPGWS